MDDFHSHNCHMKCKYGLDDTFMMDAGLCRNKTNLSPDWLKLTVITTRSVKIILVCKTDFLRKIIEMVCNWSVFYPKNQYFGLAQTNVKLDIRLIYYNAFTLPCVDFRKLGLLGWISLRWCLGKHLVQSYLSYHFSKSGLYLVCFSRKSGLYLVSDTYFLLNRLEFSSLNWAGLSFAKRKQKNHYLCDFFVK